MTRFNDGFIDDDFESVELVVCEEDKEELDRWNEEWRYRQYHRIVQTPTGKVSSIFPWADWCGIDFSQMGEVGERVVAEKIQRILDGKDHNDVGIDPRLICSGFICYTTQMMVYEGVLRAGDERTIQYDYGIDLVIFTEGWIGFDRPMNVKDIISKPERCYQVKFQPTATGYGSITVETYNDDHYHKDKPKRVSSVKGLVYSGINKSIAKHTVYIVSAATMLFMDTDELREKVSYDYLHPRYYIGTIRRKKGYPPSRSVGTTVKFHTLLQTGMAKATGVGDVFRAYLRQAHRVNAKKPPQDKHSWKLFVQDWPIETIQTYVDNGYVLSGLPVKGNPLLNPEW